jgi:hypothetical protein
MTTTFKSVHIEGKWPYKYEKPNRRVFKRETMDRANARKREIYHQKKKLLGLQVFEMDIDICNRLNQRSVHDTVKSSK